jgi:transcriptional regulator with XRE-family HTH domain
MGTAIVESAVKVFGQVVKVHRERAGLTQKQLAKVVFCSDSLISAIENGTKPAKADLVGRIDKELDAGGVILTVHPITGLGGYPSEFVASQEAEAVKIQDWDARIVPGLAQTESYARAVISAARSMATVEELDANVAIRLQRQEVLSRSAPPAPLAWLVIDESVLYRPFGGRDVMRDQLLKLERMTAMPNVVVQVMRFSATGGHPGMEGPLKLMEFTDSAPIMYHSGWNVGRITEDKEEVAAAITHFDLIRASALSPGQSLRFISKVRAARYE